MFTGLTRTIVLYLIIIAGLRLMGKRQIGELEPSELVLSLIIADLAAVPMQDYGIPLLSGVVPILTLLALTMLVSMLTVKSLFFRTLICGRPSILVRQGAIDQREMRRNRLTVDELLEELRCQGCTDLTQVAYAILETNGQLSLLLQPAHRPPTARQHSLQAPPQGLPRIVISDGVVVEDALAALGRDRPWLLAQLKAHRCAAPGDVFLMTADESGAVYVAPKEPPAARN